MDFPMFSLYKGDDMNRNFKKTSTGLFPYNRKAAYRYAKRWAYDRNPRYYDFEYIGGDCTNFASQVLYAAGCPMNYKSWQGWYYSGVNNRAPAWTSVEYLYKFLSENNKRGPIAIISSINEVEIGDIVQLNFENEDDDAFDHSPVIVRIEEPRFPSNIFVATHTNNRFDYLLSNYSYTDIRYIHVLGYRR